MLIHRPLLRVRYALASLLLFSLSAHAQTIDDGIMMGKGELQTGNHYSYDTWDQYWELGQAVAAVFVARAGADGMRTAGGTTALWQGLAAGVQARGEMAWKSQDLPARPPMLPAFGNVRGWMMTAEDFVRERPVPPP